MRWLLVLAALTLAGCATNPLPSLFVTKSAKEKEIAALRADFVKQKDDLQKQYQQAQQDLKQSMLAQMQGAANSFFGQGIVYRSILKPVRTDLLFNNLAEEGWTALGHLTPTYEAMQAMNARLAKELDETKTTLADLEKSHQSVVSENDKLAAVTKANEQRIADLKAAQADVEKQFHTQLDTLQGALNEANNKIIATEKTEGDARKAREAQLAKLSWGAGILAAALLLGAIFSPVLKQQLFLAGALAGAAAVAIPYINGLVILCAAGVGTLLLIGWALWKHHGEEKLSDGLVLALQRFKDGNPEAWKALGPIVQDQLGKYVKQDGKTVVKPDSAMDSLVEAKLKDYQQLDGKPAQPSNP